MAAIKTTNGASAAATKTDTLKKIPQKSKEVRAALRYLRMSPRKVRVVVKAVAGMNVKHAIDYLFVVNKAASRPVRKLLHSALSNGINNFQMDGDSLYIKKILVNQGPTQKRWRARAFGRAAMIRKRSSHIEVVLSERTKQADEKNIKKKAVRVKDLKLQSPESKQNEEQKSETHKKS